MEKLNKLISRFKKSQNQCINKSKLSKIIIKETKSTSLSNECNALTKFMHFKNHFKTNRTSKHKTTLSLVKLNNIDNCNNIDLDLSETISAPLSSDDKSPQEKQLISIVEENNTIFKQQELLAISKNHNKLSSSSSGSGEDSYTLEEMYNDNNIYGELNTIFSDLCNKTIESRNVNSNNQASSYNSSTSGCSSCSSCNNSSDSISDEDNLPKDKQISKSQILVKSSRFSPSNKSDSVCSSSNKLKSILINRASANNKLDVELIDTSNKKLQEVEEEEESLIYNESVSIKKLDETIRCKLTALKLISIKFNRNTHLSMVETLYELKMSQLRQNMHYSLKQFDKKSTGEQSHLNKFLTTTTKLFKSYGLRKRRTKSAEGREPELTKFANKKSETKSKHTNYYSLERDNLERKYEREMRMIQFDILKSINAVELQFQELKRQRQQIEEQEARNCINCANCMNRNSNGHDRSQQEKIRTKIHSSDLQKRIRRNQIKQYQELIGSNTSLNMTITTNLNRQSILNKSIPNLNIDIQKYRNPFAVETIV